MSDLMRLERIEKRYDGFDLGPVDLVVEQGCVTGLIGTNGSGKTTTIKAALGLISVDGGSVELFGEKTGRDGPSMAAKERIGVVFDTVSFPPETTVRDVAAMGRVAYANWDDAAFAKATGEFGLAGGKRVKELSRGMGMKLSLAFATSHDARLLVLDEPTAGLDPMARTEVLDLLRDYMTGEGRGILMSSHITTDLEKIADVVTCIDGGKVVFSVPKDDICFAAGVARLRNQEFDQVAGSGFFQEGRMRFIRRGLGVDVLVDDRRAFLRQFGECAVEPASIEAYMELMLKGETR